MAIQRVCLVGGCGKTASHAQWCGAHYKRWKRHGDPTGGGVRQGEPLAFLQHALANAKPGPCVIWPYGKTDQGRGKIHINGKTTAVHRIACEHQHGPPPSPDHEVAHNCGKGHLGCFSPFHLRWATSKENQADRREHGTLCRGNSHALSMVTEADVLEIRRLYKTGQYSHRQIAERFNISRRAISSITNGTNWAWLPL